MCVHRCSLMENWYENSHWVSDLSGFLRLYFFRAFLQSRYFISRAKTAARTSKLLFFVHLFHRCSINVTYSSYLSSRVFTEIRILFAWCVRFSSVSFYKSTGVLCCLRHATCDYVARRYRSVTFSVTWANKENWSLRRDFDFFKAGRFCNRPQEIKNRRYGELWCRYGCRARADFW